VELRLDDVSEYQVGQELKADLLADGDKVDVTAISKGKGFAGTTKRHGFGGLPAPTAPTASTGPPAPSGPAPRRPACSRARGWPVASAARRSPR
jgi:large subunit ribosomal protein L3